MTDLAAGLAPPPAWQDPEPPEPRGPNVQREWALQRGCKRFCRRAVAVEHEFVAHDRSAKKTERQHIGEANRGVRAGWMDTELPFLGGATFRCELKEPGWSPPRETAKSGERWRKQRRLIVRMNELQHPTSWANSVVMYAEEALKAGVPLNPNWRTVAAHEDELVAADIRKQEARVAQPSRPKSRARSTGPKPSAGRLRKIAAVRGRVMF